MLRVLGAMLLASASVANAGEHYVEIWNPPEARQAPHAGSHAAAKPRPHRVSAASHAAKAKPNHVAASTPKPIKRSPAARAVTANTPPQLRDLPPLLTPGGNVLRVGTRGAQPEVTR
ncbi:hypothetical protein FAZ69_00940 [Trinickia terrae]|uniref:Uncharacterized protein n=1 Tax=Trinickia terrae TaxID=2571161 RepID=A0A4U1IF23_9BURK|nr:hypothetical protein [Trinickia terrae]TKC92288.1 hypothetical protein FAZ69_00940 [Trinickia terrae]